MYTASFIAILRSVVSRLAKIPPPITTWHQELREHPKITLSKNHYIQLPNRDFYGTHRANTHLIGIQR